MLRIPGFENRGHRVKVERKFFDCRKEVSLQLDMYIGGESSGDMT